MADSRDDKIWHIAVQGVSEGPYSQIDIENRLKGGHLTSTDLVFRTGFTKWTPILECFEFGFQDSVVKAVETMPPVRKKSNKKKVPYKKYAIAGLGAVFGIPLILVGFKFLGSKAPRRFPEPIGFGPPAQNIGASAIANISSHSLSLQMANLGLQVTIQTDLPAGTDMVAEIVAPYGSILRFPSFHLTKRFVIKLNQPTILDLAQEQLPYGDYNMTVSGGGLVTHSPLAIGTHDQDFNKKLSEYQMSLTKQRKTELTLLENGGKNLSKKYSSFTSEFQKVSKHLNPKTKQVWNKRVAAWRKELAKDQKAVSWIVEKNKNTYVYGDQLIQLKNITMKLPAVLNEFSQKINSKRNVASATYPPSTFKSDLAKFYEAIQNLK